MKNKRVC